MSQDASLCQSALEPTLTLTAHLPWWVPLGSEATSPQPCQLVGLYMSNV